MKIQSLAIIFIIIILPISLILEAYTQSRIETLSIQTEYDSKLYDATYDALKAYQLNSFNSDTSDYSNSKMRDIRASINTFFNSMSTNFASLGYSKATLQNYIPAIVYTMYDGYYIYSPFKNTWHTENEGTEIENEITEQTQKSVTYSDGTNLYGLKPYVYYSCRYKTANMDIVITYTLDNYIEIQGTINDVPVSKYGYLLSNVSEDGTKYRGTKIDTEELSEKICVNGEVKKYKYIKENGTKYYLNGSEVFTVINGKKVVQNNYDINKIKNNNSAQKYYKEAYELQKFMKEYKLDELKTSDIVDMETGKKYTEETNTNNPYYKISGKIFDFDYSKGIEEETSNFNTHRIDVIKNSIIRNLSVAISNFNNYSGVNTDFQMPQLKDADWDKIMDNISIITFLQGMGIGAKVYNGYSIISNTKNQDVVMEDSIYINVRDVECMRITDANLKDIQGSDISPGIFNVDLERRSGEDKDGNIIYYFPQEHVLSYDSIVTQNKVAKDTDQSLLTYLDNSEIDSEIKSYYYTALGRERYGLYRPKLEINSSEY